MSRKVGKILLSILAVLVIAAMPLVLYYMLTEMGVPAF